MKDNSMFLNSYLYPRIKYMSSVELFSYRTYDAELGNLGNGREGPFCPRTLKFEKADP